MCYFLPLLNEFSTKMLVTSLPGFRYLQWILISKCTDINREITRVFCSLKSNLYFEIIYYCKFILNNFILFSFQTQICHRTKVSLSHFKTMKHALTITLYIFCNLNFTLILKYVWHGNIVQFTWKPENLGEDQQSAW